MDFVLDKLLDIVIAVLSTFFGVLAVYWTTRPVMEIDSSIKRGSHDDGRPKYHTRVRPRRRVLLRLWVIEMHIHVYLQIPGTVRSTTVPLPISTATWREIRAPRKSHQWTAVPRLLLEDVDWDRYLPAAIPPPSRPIDLENFLNSTKARLFVEVVATGAIFGSSTVTRKRFSAVDFQPGPNSTYVFAPTGPVPEPGDLADS